MAKLAINGGSKAAEGLQEVQWPRAPKGALERINRVLESGKWYRSGEESCISLFEHSFAAYHDSRHAIAVANGTVAIELALLTLGVRPGDEVLVPALTFIASASAIVRTGAIPIFVDCDPNTCQVSAEAIEQAITSRTRGVVVVHYGGYPIDFDAVLPVCERHGLFVIEDCAHAQGSEWKGRKVGAIGNMGTFSFQTSKSFSLGEGGMVLTDDDQLFEQALLIQNVGRRVGLPGYAHLVASSNYRMSEISAALGLAQMEVFPAEAEIRHEHGMILAEGLRKIGGVDPLSADERITRRGYYFLVINYAPGDFEGLSRDRFLQALMAEGVPCAAAYGIPLYKQPAFSSQTIRLQYPEGTKLPDYEHLHLPAAEMICSRQVTVPHTLLLGARSDLTLILGAISKIKGNVRELL